MEDGHGAGSGDRREPAPRRSTVSGAWRQDDDEENKDKLEAMRFPWSSSPSVPTSPITPPSPGSSKSGHRRAFSGSLLQKLSFLRGNSDEGKEPPKSPKSAKSRKSIDDDVPVTSPESPHKPEQAMVIALQAPKTRKRKGSLRKTALLGGRRFASEGRERKNSFTAKSPLGKLSVQHAIQAPMKLVETADAPAADDEEEVDDDQPTPGPRTQLSYEYDLSQSSSDSGWSEPAAVTATRLILITEAKAQLHQNPTANSSTDQLGSPVDIKSPISNASYASTTDDDDILTFDRRPTTSFPDPSALTLPKPISSTSTSYFPSVSDVSLPRHRSTRSSKRSPLSHTISSSSLYSHPTPPPHDYTETEYWGWVILFVTWLTFTVGMGSCLEVWSWAWDVGETPYAPPELEDDPTLPIVGYYPALGVLVGVVAWVWITVAWVGMKYDFADTVSIEVTSNHNEATFQVPKALICARSKPISVHCATRNDVFELDGYHDLDIFNTYLQLLYTGQIVLEPSRAEHDEDCLKTISDFLALYEVVDELDDLVAKNAITDALVRYRGRRDPRATCLRSCTERFGIPSLPALRGGSWCASRHASMGYQRVIAQGTAGRSFAEYDGKEFHVSANEEEERW